MKIGIAVISDKNSNSSGKWWKKVIALVNDEKIAMTVISDENSDSSDKW